MLVGPIMAVDATIVVRTLGHKNCSKTELTKRADYRKKFRTMQFSIA